MTVSAEIEANILRYYHVEKWRVGTIAHQLHVHHSVIKRVLLQAGIPRINLTRHKSLIDPYLPFILETLKKFPTLTASRLYAMVCERGYAGKPDHFRHLIAFHRPRPFAEAYLRLRTLPGEQAQVDWGHFDYITIGRAKRPLMGFVMVLSFSRKIFLHFFLNQRMSNFLQGHEAAFQAFGGVPRVLLYDNLKSAVLERQGDAIRFHPTLLSFAAHYRFEPRPVAVARGNEKGRVERAIRYVRDNFFAARQWKNINDLNAQAVDWCEGQAANRLCPEDTSMTVKEVFLQEKSKLFVLPDNPYPTFDREEVSVGKTPYVRFDLNDYSVPHTHVRRILTVIATNDKVKVLDGQQVIAEHARSYDKKQQIESKEHIDALIDFKKKAGQHRAQDRLIKSIPSCAEFLSQAAELGYSLRTITRNLLHLLDSYGANELEIAIKEALRRKVPHTNAIRFSLEKRRQEIKLSPPVNLDLPHDARVRDLVVRPHKLDDYDQLHTTTGETS